MTPRTPTRVLLLALMGSALPLAAQASMNLALEKGCLGCHGTPPRGKAPTMTELATRYAAAQGDENEIARLTAHLREHHLFGGVAAHERLSAEEAGRFVRWLVDGGR
jgi:cytochrome c551/c552